MKHILIVPVLALFSACAPVDESALELDSESQLLEKPGLAARWQCDTSGLSDGVEHLFTSVAVTESLAQSRSLHACELSQMDLCIPLGCTDLNASDVDD
jgi:hypothetical protein